MAWDPPVTNFQASGVAILAANLNKMANALLYLEPLYFNTVTSPVNVTSTASATPDVLISSGSLAYENDLYWFTFFCSNVQFVNAVTNHVLLCNGSTEIMTVRSETRATGNLNGYTFLSVPYTPTAANHTMQFCSFNSSAGTTVYNFGAGSGATIQAPGYLLITRAVPALNP